MKVLYQLATDLNGDGKDAALCDGNGKMWRLPFDTPTEFENEYMADKLVEHCHYYGIVIVHTTKTRHGIDYNMDDARERARLSLNASIDACINDYILNQMQDRVRNNFPPLPPEGRALECCIIRKYNLYKAGIRLIGWAPPYEMTDPGYGATAIGSGTPVNIQEQINQLSMQLLTQSQLIMELLQGKAVEVKKGKGQGKVEAKVEAKPEAATEAANAPDTPDEYEQDQQPPAPAPAPVPVPAPTRGIRL